MTINFEADSYSLSEGNTEDLCLILTGSTEVDVLVNLHVGEEGTASMLNFCSVIHYLKLCTFYQVRMTTELRLPS